MSELVSAAIFLFSAYSVTGTCILSLFCLQAGAKKVYAVEGSEIMMEAKKVVDSLSPTSGKLFLLNKRVEELSVVDIPEQVDIIVSEWMGYCLFYEGMLDSVLLARDKWLKPGGMLYPSSASLFLCPITDEEVFQERVFFLE
eukprot:TRINITY_DN3951_c0_g1_i5.p2 TRINITY_DN3951_c0_g1~~TRINITY_DN3951_c0_g1_i5.p2  ORF type:complete len:142 (-),score=30.95 TRINITY_DN3951_c0_g1_i5:651-1076(-)